MEQTGNKMLTVDVLFHYFIEHMIHGIHIFIVLCVIVQVNMCVLELPPVFNNLTTHHHKSEAGPLQAAF